MRRGAPSLRLIINPHPPRNVGGAAIGCPSRVGELLSGVAGARRSFTASVSASGWKRLEWRERWLPVEALRAVWVPRSLERAVEEGRALQVSLRRELPGTAASIVLVETAPIGEARRLELVAGPTVLGRWLGALDLGEAGEGVRVAAWIGSSMDASLPSYTPH